MDENGNVHLVLSNGDQYMEEEDGMGCGDGGGQLMEEVDDEQFLQMMQGRAGRGDERRGRREEGNAD